MQITKDTKITVSNGCLEWMQQEIENLRNENSRLKDKVETMENFFSLVNRLGGKPGEAYGQDLFWQAKNEIREAIKKVGQPVPSGREE